MGEKNLIITEKPVIIIYDPILFNTALLIKIVEE